MVDIIAERLHNQRLHESQAVSAVEIVRRLGAVQSQEQHGGRWSIGIRTGGTDADVEAAFAAKDIVRIFTMRGTIHIVAAEDMRWLQKIVGPKVKRLLPTTLAYNKTTIHDGDYDKGREALEKAMAGKAPFTRDEVNAAMADAGIETNAHGYMKILQTIQLDGVVCYGTNRGKQQTFTLTEEWLPPAPMLTREEGIAEMARRFFTGHGPATVYDYANWLGITLTEARAGLAEVRSAFERFDFDGREYYYVPSAGDAVPQHPYIHLLPTYDEFFIGYKNRIGFITPEYYARWMAREDRIVSPFMVDGRMIGVWRRELTKKEIRFILEPYEPLSADIEAELHRAASRYAAFLGLTPVIV